MSRSSLTLLLLALPLSATEPKADAAKHFELRIRPLFVEHCIGCHGPAKQKAGLRLDSAEGFRKGGVSKSLVVPGEPAKSLLLKAVRHVGHPGRSVAKFPQDRAASAIGDGAKDPVQLFLMINHMVYSMACLGDYGQSLGGIA